jgi:hypothetical protein
MCMGVYARAREETARVASVTTFLTLMRSAQSARLSLAVAPCAHMRGCVPTCTCTYIHMHMSHVDAHAHVPTPSPELAALLVGLSVGRAGGRGPLRQGCARPVPKCRGPHGPWPPTRAV